MVSWEDSQGVIHPQGGAIYLSGVTEDETKRDAEFMAILEGHK